MKHSDRRNGRPAPAGHEGIGGRQDPRFDEACGNHGQDVSYVARNGTEPPCATGVRNGSTTPTTASKGSETTDDSKNGGKPAKAGAKNGTPGNSGRTGR